MPGTLKIRLKAGCTPEEVLMVLSGTAEPNGGDHYATIQWGFNPVASVLNIQLEVSPGVWIPAPSTYLFTSAGEQYTLRASGPEEALEKLAGLQFPYKVYGLYAPDWASVYGEIQSSLNNAACCPPGTPDGTPNVIATLTINGGCSSPCVSGSIDAVASKSVAMYNTSLVGTPPPPCTAVPNEDVGAGGTKTYNVTLGTGTWEFFERELTMAGSASVPSEVGTATVSVLLTKPANSYAGTLTLTIGAVTITKLGTYTAPSENCAASLPTCGDTVGESGEFTIAAEALECSALSLRIKCTFTGSFSYAVRPATTDFCCLCEDTFGTKYHGWSSSLSLNTLKVLTE
jgi:hypothetical protein